MLKHWFVVYGKTKEETESKVKKTSIGCNFTSDQRHIGKQEVSPDPTDTHLQIHSTAPPFFYQLPSLFPCVFAEPPRKKEYVKSCGNKMNYWVCPLFIMSLTHRLFMWQSEGWPLLFPASLHPRVSHSAQAWLRGKLKLFCSGEFLEEIVKAVTVWGFISPERRRGRKDRVRGQEGEGGEYQRRI